MASLDAGAAAPPKAARKPRAPPTRSCSALFPKAAAEDDDLDLSGLMKVLVAAAAR